MADEEEILVATVVDPAQLSRTSEVMRALHDLVESAAAIDGVSVGAFDDKATWRIDFADSATQTQRDAAQAVIDNFAVESVAQKNLIAKEDVLTRLGDEKIAAILNSEDIGVKVWLEKFRAGSDPINLNDPRVAVGFDTLIAAGVVDAADVARVLGG